MFAPRDFILWLCGGLIGTANFKVKKFKRKQKFPEFPMLFTNQHTRPLYWISLNCCT